MSGFSELEEQIKAADVDLQHHRWGEAVHETRHAVLLRQQHARGNAGSLSESDVLAVGSCAPVGIKPAGEDAVKKRRMRRVVRKRAVCLRDTTRRLARRLQFACLNQNFGLDLDEHFVPAMDEAAAFA